MTEEITFSVLLRWDDNDKEQGEFGVFVRASDHEEAERLARIAMRECHIANYGEDTVELYESADGTFGGSVVDCHEGAIWKAKELEEALRDLLAQCDEIARTRGWPDNEPRNKARAILDEIDDIGKDDENTCRTCGESYADGGDGYDGECPDCADKTDQKLNPENYE